MEFVLLVRYSKVHNTLDYQVSWSLQNSCESSAGILSWKSDNRDKPYCVSTNSLTDLAFYILKSRAKEMAFTTEIIFSCESIVILSTNLVLGIVNIPSRFTTHF